MNHFQLGRLTGATLTVLVTTLDDSVWLIPYVTKSPFGIIHAFAFLLALLGLSIACCILSISIKKGLDFDEEKSSFRLQLIAVVFCWSLAFFLLLQKLVKTTKASTAGISTSCR
mmetsp:Transcript_13132/g.17180  ORF Transcript_13132/g.17180 Transcript_13132/m.17180 type:complete len:114 (+) Transcript_13132:122-463(+)